MKSPLLTLLCLITMAATAKESNLLFIENAGQVTDQYHKPRTDIHFSLKAPGMNIFIGAGEIHYQFSEAKTIETKQDLLTDPFHNNGGTSLISTHRIDLELIGANKNITPLKEGQLKYYERYYTPQFGEQGGLAHSYSKIIYKDIYPHIDWIIYINGDQLEYDFLVNEGGDVADIKMRYNGADINTDIKGDLLISSVKGSITEHKPLAYQTDGRTIPASFKVKDNVVSFSAAAYNGSLLIDPYIEWATFYGGTVQEEGSVAVDDADNSYMSGQTFSSNSIATTGAYDISYSDSGDLFITKFNSAGTRIWGTYYGGTATDLWGFVAYDGHGSICVCGGTNNATGIATTGSDQPTFGGPYVPEFFSEFLGDVFLVKFDTNGSRIWATYFGGSGKETPKRIECDTSGNIYLVGSTYSTANIATSGAHQQNKDGNANTYDGFIVKYSNTGQKLWSTYYGGSLQDLCYGITISSQNRVFVCGSTSSPNSISTNGAYQTTLPSLMSGFIAEFDENGTRQWGTYFGGNTASAFTHLFAVSCNPNGDVFVSGGTNDQSGLTTTGVHQPLYGGDGGPYLIGDIIFAKFDNSGNRIWSSYLGGSGGENASIKCGQSGELYIAGTTTSSNNIALNAFQGNFMGGSPYNMDGLLAKFNDVDGSCVWSTYLGGTGDDQLGFVKTSPNNHLYVIGTGTSFPTTSGSHQPNFGGGMYDAYLAKFYDFPTGLSQPTQTTTAINLYPSPNNGTFTLTATLPQNEQANLTITNITGQQVHKETFTTPATQFSKQITLNPTLSPGLYILTLTTTNTSITKRFVKN